MIKYLREKLSEITEQLNDAIYDIDLFYDHYEELILRHRTITKVLYMCIEYKNVDTLKALLADKIRMEQILQKGYNRHYSNNDEYSELTDQSNIVIDILSEVIEFINSHK
jgi:hypothetical protein